MYTKRNSLLRRFLLGSSLLLAMFAVAGGALFFADSAGAQETEPEAETEQVIPPGAAFQRRGHGGPFAGPHAGFVDKTTIDQAIADALGIELADLEAAYEDGTRWPELADELGVAVETVQTAIHNAMVAGVEAAIEAGDLSEAQGAEILEHMELRQLHAVIVDRDVIHQAIADTLGISVADLEEARQNGTPMHELLEDAGVTPQDLHEVVEAARQEMLQEALDAGTIDQEQFDALSEMPGGPGFGFAGRGPGRGFGRHGGQGPGDCGPGGRGFGPRGGGFGPGNGPAIDTQTSDA